jgi:mono/diheme cytochrome c family protein
LEHTIQTAVRINLNRDIKSFIFPLLFLISLLTSFSAFAQDDAAIQAGKKLFNANCAACHKLNKRAVGPALKGVSRPNMIKNGYTVGLKNSTAMVKSGDAQAVAIYEEYNGSVMTSFPSTFYMTDIDNIITYTDYTPPAPVAVAPTTSRSFSRRFWN